MATFAQEPLEYLLSKAPTVADKDVAIRLLNEVPVSGFLRRRLFGRWAHSVRYIPSPADYERAARDLSANQSRGQQ